MRRWVLRIGLMVLVTTALLAVSGIALADNCGGLFDCWFGAGAAGAAAAGAGAAAAGGFFSGGGRGSEDASGHSGDPLSDLIDDLGDISDAPPHEPGWGEKLADGLNDFFKDQVEGLKDFKDLVEDQVEDIHDTIASDPGGRRILGISEEESDAIRETREGAEGDEPGDDIRRILDE